MLCTDKLLACEYWEEIMGIGDSMSKCEKISWGRVVMVKQNLIVCKAYQPHSVQPMNIHWLASIKPIQYSALKLVSCHAHNV